MQDPVIPEPVISWRLLVQVSDPLKDASRARYRTLLKRGIGSKGLSVVHRGKDRLTGRSTVHSVLAAFALRAEQIGDHRGALQLTRAADKIESRYAADFETFLHAHDPNELPLADFYESLLKDTNAALGSWGGVADLVFASGRLASLDADSVYIEAKTRSGEDVDFAIPRVLADEQGIDPGDYVWVFRRLVGHASVVDLLPAVRWVSIVPSEHAFPAEPRAHGNSGTWEPEPRESELAAAYEEGPGALPTSDELRQVATASARRRRRKVQILV